MEQKKPVGIWLRVSTDFQVKDDSPEHHEKRGRLYADAKEWEVREVYRLDAISGKSVMNQPETKRMLRDIRSGHITGLIFSKLARLARNTKELIEFAEIFRESNADLISLGESIDTSTPAGRLFYTMIAAMATWEREEISARVAASVPIRAKMGKPLGGQGSFGYRWNGKELVIDEKEAPVRKLIYELFKEHKRKMVVSKILNEKGYRTRKGAKFTDTTIGRLLRDPTAKGQRITNYSKSFDSKKAWILKPKEEWIIVTCPAIVTEELWDECNKILDSQEKKYNKPSKRPVHIFTGILYCECGSKMHVPTASNKYICLTCRKNRIEKQDLEEIFYENLKSFVLNDQHLETFLEKASEKIEIKKKEIAVLKLEKVRLRVEMDKLIELHMSGEIPKEGFSTYYNPLHEQFKQIESAIPELEGEIDFLTIEHFNSDVFLSEAESLFDRWKLFDNEAKHSIVEQITDSITLSKDEIKIKFTYTPSSSNPQQIPNAGMPLRFL